MTYFNSCQLKRGNMLLYFYVTEHTLPVILKFQATPRNVIARTTYDKGAIFLLVSWF